MPLLHSRYIKDLDTLACDLVDQFPELAKEDGRSRLVDRIKLVKDALVNKTRNKRRRCSSPEVENKKRKKLLDNYAPSVGLDVVAVQQHVSLMKTADLSESELDKAMDATLADRRSIVMKGSLKELRHVYPRLFTEDQIWKELARVRGKGSSGADEKREACSDIMEFATKLQRQTGCKTEDAVDSLLRALGEHRYVFPSSEEGVQAHPCVVGTALYVCGKKICDVRDADSGELLALWGASFTVFAQRLSFQRCKSSATLMCCVVLKTDKLAGRQLTARLSALLKALDHSHPSALGREQ
ncbi:hypothetical protein FJT64_015135 [Amphibalanus amphitrite]|uniref:Uncharacterized protein n=1 Tax=Amphibalanus amphitrite TaxID=1232801 RepID=A0A6A4X3W4_AMPAM|nr:hypothetical protein FJT64_015135 [Amphibalanus amphitrite]